MHVTILYSKSPLDWSRFVPDQTHVKVKNSKRTTEQLGDEGATVLGFAAPALARRHAQFVAGGASHDYDSYKPHVTLTYKPQDLEGIKPYDGLIEFGPEEFQDIQGSFDPDTLVEKEGNPNHDSLGRFASAAGAGGAAGGHVQAEIDELKAHGFEFRLDAERWSELSPKIKKEKDK